MFTAILGASGFGVNQGFRVYGSKGHNIVRCVNPNLRNPESQPPPPPPNANQKVKDP